MSKRSKKAIKAKKDIDKKLEDWKIKGKKKWGDRCEICGSMECVQGHHFFAKKHYKSLMFDVNNYVPLCRSHHFQLERLKRMDIAYQVIIIRGIKWIKKLREKL